MSVVRLEEVLQKAALWQEKYEPPRETGDSRSVIPYGTAGFRAK